MSRICNYLTPVYLYLYFSSYLPILSRPANRWLGFVICYNPWCAGVVQRLVCEFSKLEIGVRFPAPAPGSVHLVEMCGSW